MTKEIEKAERDLKNLEQQREALFSRARLLSEERDQIAFAALTANDKRAKERLREINLEDTNLGANLASVEAALTVARVNLADAKVAEAQAADRANALQIRELNKRFLELGLIVDDAFADVISASAEMREVLDRMRALGIASPTHHQFNVLGLIACKTAVMNVPWSSGGREWEFLAPNQRKSFKSIALGWSEMIERQNAQRLGVDKKKDAA
jgi:hypothetical protein